MAALASAAYSTSPLPSKKRPPPAGTLRSRPRIAPRPRPCKTATSMGRAMRTIICRDPSPSQGSRTEPPI